MKTIKIVMYFMALTALFNACKGPMDEITSVDYPRAFSPVTLTIEPHAYDNVTAHWIAVDGARSYVVELSQGDSLLFNNIVATYETESLSQNLTGLWGETRYSVRVKAQAFNEGQEDSKWTAIVFTTNAEQIFYTVSNDDIKTRQITLHWTPNETVTKLTVTPGIGDIILTPAEIAAGEITLTDLTPVTQYTISIYNGEQRRGMVSVTTKWRPSGPDVIEISIGDNLSTFITNPANVGKIILLPEGYTYTWDGGTTPAGGFTVYGDPDGDQPVITCSTGTPLVLNGLTSGNDIIHFENVELVCTNTSGYFVNQGTDAANNACSIKRLSFENCRLADFGRSIVRAQAVNERFDTIRINNCLIENCSKESGQNYALIQCTVASEAFSNIIISNTTTNGSYSNFLNVGGGAGQPSGKNVTLQNCTFYKTVGSNSATPDNRFLIDGGNNGPLNITIRNCILGSVRGVGNERGYRMNSAGTLTATGNYATTDWTTIADNTQTPPFQNVPATAYSGTCTSLFADPENGDFHIKDAGFAGKATAGDPRWW